MTELYEIIGKAALVSVFLGTAALAVRRPDGQRRDAVLLFGALSVHIVLDAAYRIGLADTWARTGAQVAFVLEPLLIVHMVRHFRAVARWLYRGAILSGLASGTAFIIFGLERMPVALFAAIVIYTLAGNGYAAIAFSDGAARSSGPARYRQVAAAGGTTALLIAVMSEGVWLILPRFGEILLFLYGFCFLLMAFAFPLAFQPPAVVRRAWEAIALRDYSEALLGRLGRGDRNAIQRHFVETARRATGAQHAELHHEAAALPDPAERAAAASLENGPQYVIGARGPVALVPLRERPTDPTFIACRFDVPLAFPDENLALVALLARQTRIALADTNAVAAQRRALEQSREVERFKSDFMRAMSHELGNPLSPIKIQLHMLQTRPLDETRRTRSLQIIANGVEKLGNLVRSMHDVALLQDARMQIRHDRTDLAVIVAKSVRDYTPLANDAHCPIHLEVVGPTYVDGDSGRLAQVVDNLLSNAVKYSPAGGDIEVRLRHEGDRAIVEFEDHGVGVDANDLGRLFQPYTRLHEGRLPTVSGTGLGLHIARGIAELHGGTIEASSEGTGHGTTMCLVLPLADVKAAPSPGSAPTRNAGAAAARRR